MKKKNSLFLFVLVFAIGAISILAQTPDRAAAAEVDGIKERFQNMFQIPIFTAFPVDRNMIVTPPRVPEERRIVRVPSFGYPDIQSAIANGRTILLMPRLEPYYENVTIPTRTEVTIRSMNPGQMAFIDGQAGNAISLGIEATLKMSYVGVITTQPLSTYDRAAIFGWGGPRFNIDHGSIKSPGIGISSSYAYNTTISHTTFLGGSNESVGALIGYQNGSLVYNNTFSNLTIGIYDQQIGGGTLQDYIKLCGRHHCTGDTNIYPQTTVPIFFQGL